MTERLESSGLSALLFGVGTVQSKEKDQGRQSPGCWPSEPP